jgi:tetratricopeptide (TPR) repeat protein
MPSHIYLRTGFYEKGVAVNEAAVKSYNRMKELYSPVSTADFLYVIHNLHMQANNALMQGVYAKSVSSAADTRKSIPADYLAIPGPMGNYIQYIHMTPVLVNVRFGNWDRLLDEPEPASTHLYARILYHFGRGMALARKPRMNEAEAELAAIRNLMKDSSLAIPMSPFSAAIEGATVAENILAGTIALQEERYTEAITAFTKAMETESLMVYNEPRDWMLNPRHYLGNALLKAGRSAEALKVLEKDLELNQENGWALYGCMQALKDQNNKPAADKYMTRFRIAFGQSDVTLHGPVF